MSTIPVNTNILLWLLTGRNKFVSDVLNTGVAFIAEPEGPEVKAVRSLMRFDDTSTDAYIIPPHSAMLAQKPLLDGLPGVDQSLSFLRQVTPESSTVIGASPVPHNGRPYVVDGSLAAKRGFSVVVTTKDGSRANVALDGVTVGSYPFDLSNGSRLVVEELAAFGVPPAAIVDSWEDGDSFSYKVIPRPYPYDTFADKLKNSAEAISLMSTQGTLEAFSEATSDLEKVGVACVALCKARKKELYNQQVALTVDGGIVAGITFALPDKLTEEVC